MRTLIFVLLAVALANANSNLNFNLQDIVNTKALQPNAAEYDCSFVSQMQTTLSKILYVVACQSPTNGPCTQTQLQAAAAIAANGNNQITHFWAVIVNLAGRVCAVATSSDPTTNAEIAWRGGRLLAAQKAFTALSFSTNNYAISTAQLWAAVNNPNSIQAALNPLAFHASTSLPVDAVSAYAGFVGNWGNACGTDNQDPFCGKRIGGFVATAGGLGLYAKNPTDPTKLSKLVGAIAVAGSSPCTDHIVAWKIRSQLQLDYVPCGPVQTFAAIPVDCATNVPNTAQVTTLNGDAFIVTKLGVPTFYSHPLCDKSTNIEDLLTTNLTPTRGLN